MIYAEPDSIDRVLLLASRELGQTARKYRREPDKYLEIAAARALSIRSQYKVLLFPGGRSILVEPKKLDRYLLDPVDRALLRAVIIRIERSSEFLSLSKTLRLLNEARDGVRFARERQFFALAAQVCRDAAAIANAQRLYGVADEFLCKMHRNSTDTYKRGSWPWVRGKIAFYLAGYGYRPYNLAIFIALMITLLSGVLALFAKWTFIDALVETSWNYLAFGAPADFSRVPTWFKYVLVPQSLLAIVANSTLVAMLGRKWLRDA